MLSNLHLDSIGSKKRVDNMIILLCDQGPVCEVYLNHGSCFHNNSSLHIKQKQYDDLLYVFDGDIVLINEYLTFKYSNTFKKDPVTNHGIYVTQDDFNNNQIINDFKENKINIGKMILEMYFDKNYLICLAKFDNLFSSCPCSGIHITNNGIIGAIENNLKNKKTIFPSNNNIQHNQQNEAQKPNEQKEENSMIVRNAINLTFKFS